MHLSRPFVCGLALSVTLFSTAELLTAQIAKPTIAALAQPTAEPGDPLTINGTNLGAPSATSTVKFGSTVATVIKSWSDKTITVTVPDVPAGSADIVVTVGGQSSDPQQLTVIVPTIPIAVAPQVIQPANGKLPASINLAVLEKNCDDKTGTDLTQPISAPYSLTITGSGLTPSSPKRE